MFKKGGLNPIVQLLVQLKNKLANTTKEVELISIAKSINLIKSQLISSQEFHKIDKNIIESHSNKPTNTNATKSEKLVFSTLRAIDFCNAVLNNLQTFFNEIVQKKETKKLELFNEWMKKISPTLKI